MSYANNQFKELVNEAIHNHFHDKTELEMTLKDWLYGICEQLDEYEAKAIFFDEVSFIFADSIAHDYDDHSIVQNIARVIEKEKGDYYV